MLKADGLTGSRQGSQVLDGPVLTVDGLTQQAGRAAQQGFLIQPVQIAVGLTGGSRQGSQVLDGPVLTVDGLRHQAGLAAQPGF